MTMIFVSAIFAGVLTASALVPEPAGHSPVHTTSENYASAPIKLASCKVSDAHSITLYLNRLNLSLLLEDDSKYSKINRIILNNVYQDVYAASSGNATIIEADSPQGIAKIFIDANIDDGQNTVFEFYRNHRLIKIVCVRSSVSIPRNNWRGPNGEWPATDVWSLIYLKITKPFNFDLNFPHDRRLWSDLWHSWPNNSTPHKSPE